jgi:hypothetical protein
MKARYFARASAVGLVLLIGLFLAGLQPLMADEITMQVNAFGNGPAGSESITGTFQFDSTTGIVSNGSFVGTGLISESWTFGPVAGSFATGSSDLPPGVQPTGGRYVYNGGSIVGSLGDTLPFSWVLDAGGVGGFIPPGGGVIGDASVGYTDSFGGDFIVPTRATTPEPPVWLLILVGGVVISAIKWKMSLA